MSKKYSYQCVAPQLNHLRFVGYFQIDPRSSKIYRCLHTIYMRFCLVWVSTYALQQAVKMYEVRDDMDKVMATLFLFLTYTDSIYKQVVLWVKADDIEELLDIMRGPIYNQGRPEHKNYLLTTARHSKILLWIDNIMALFTCFLWVMYPLSLHLQGKAIELTSWMPIDYNRDPQFYITSVYVWITTSAQGFGNTTMDVLIAFLLAQCQAQLRILRYELSNLVQRCKEEEKESKYTYEQILRRRFKELLDHHVVILYFAKKVEEIFSGAIFYQFLIGGWIVCTSVYRIVDMEPASVQFVSMASYMYCILIQVFLYCYYGSEVTYESEKLTEAIYTMDWLKTPVIHRKHMIILMERVKRPIQPLAGNVIPLSNDTFVRILKSSYSFFTLLRTTHE